jgi:hypothetical protein
MKIGATLLAGAIALSMALPAFAQDAKPAEPSPAEDDPKKTEARSLFATGVDNVKKFQWAEALAAFERSQALIPSAITSLNIGVCERALGRYVRAGRSFERALAEHSGGVGAPLSETSVADTKGYLTEIESIVVRAKVTVRPVDASITVDGKPLAVVKAGDKTVFAAGVEAPGPGGKVPAETFEILLDPGNHVFVLSRKGFSDAVVNRTFAPGKPAEAVFELEKLPATLKVSSSITGAIVRVAEVDVGPVPVDVLRPAGQYPVLVSKEGYVPYETSITVKAGEEAKINAVLAEESLNVAEQWWFWTSIGAGLTTAALVTYFVVRPEPDPPPYNGGSTGWVVQPTAIRF